MSINLKTALALGALALAGALAPATEAKAEEGTWCAEAGGRSSYGNCGYYSFRQCLAAVSGVGGTCRPNPRVVTYVIEDEDGQRIYRRYYR
jgi:hypothetical protein